MSILTILFYAIALLITVSTAMAVTRRNMVHAVLYLVLSFFGTAMLFYLLGAPFLAALEIIIYAGAIMVLFLFLIMMIRLKKPPDMFFPINQLLPAIFISLGFVIVSTLLLGRGAAGWQPMAAAQADPVDFGIYLFQTHWLAVEIASMLLLVALVGAYLLGLRARRTQTVIEEASS
jgi:NADH-quinone oxidoreductase subunit J